MPRNLSPFVVSGLETRVSHRYLIICWKCFSHANLPNQISSNKTGRVEKGLLFRCFLLVFTLFNELDQPKAHYLSRMTASQVQLICPALDSRRLYPERQIPPYKKKERLSCWVGRFFLLSSSNRTLQYSHDSWIGWCQWRIVCLSRVPSRIFVDVGFWVRWQVKRAADSWFIHHLLAARSVRNL